VTPRKVKWTPITYYRGRQKSANPAVMGPEAPYKKKECSHELKRVNSRSKKKGVPISFNITGIWELGATCGRKQWRGAIKEGAWRGNASKKSSR